MSFYLSYLHAFDIVREDCRLCAFRVDRIPLDLFDFIREILRGMKIYYKF